MSHLREQISALIDGELTGAELDRANAHLAACARCRDEAAALRELKRELRALAVAPPDKTPDTGPAAGSPGDRGAGWDDDALTRRLLAMAGPGGPVPSRSFRREQSRRRRREQRGGRPGSGPGGPGAPGAPGGPRAPGGPYAGHTPWGPRHRGRYMLWSALSLVVVGVGTAAFTMGGGNPQPGPKIPLQQELQMFDLEHAITSGDIPFPGPSLTPTARP